MERIMLVEDDQQIIANISQTLRKWQYEPVVVKDWNRVAEEVAASQSDLVLCDITLPTFDGFYWIQEVRKKSAVPIIVISAADIDANVMHAVSAGADDYIMKPFSGAVLLAKIQAILRRNKPQVGRQLAFAGASFNSLTNELVKDGQAVQLTPTEGAMLQILLRQKGQAIHVQVLLIFFFPLAGGLLNMLIAAPAVKKVLYEFSIYNSAMMLKVAFWVTVAVFAFYLAIYAITTRVYRRIVG